MYKDENDYELVYMIKEENEDAKEILFEKYKPLVEIKAKKYISQIQNMGYEFSDLMQEGMLALSNAINDYENNKKVKFSTFANLCLDRQLQTFIRDMNRQKHKNLNDSISIDDEDKALINMISDENSKNPEASFLYLEEQADLKKRVYKYLTDKERQVFDLRLEDLSYQDIALLLNTSVKSIDRTVARIKEKIDKVRDKII